MDDEPLNIDGDPDNRNWLRGKYGAQFVVRRFNGDDRYSWAVFRKADLPDDVRRGGINARPVFYGEAKPVVSGLSKREAVAERDRLISSDDGP